MATANTQTGEGTTTRLVPSLHHGQQESDLRSVFQILVPNLDYRMTEDEEEGVVGIQLPKGWVSAYLLRGRTHHHMPQKRFYFPEAIVTDAIYLYL